MSFSTNNTPFQGQVAIDEYSIFVCVFSPDVVLEIKLRETNKTLYWQELERFLMSLVHPCYYWVQKNEGINYSLRRSWSLRFLLVALFGV